MSETSIYTAVVHAGEDPASHLGSLSSPVYHSAIFTFPDAEHGAAIHEGERVGFFYGRLGNPTQAAFEGAMCQLEGGQSALGFASGMAAVTSSLFTLLRRGDHIVAPQSLYATTYALLDGMLSPLGIDVTYVDASDAKQYENAICSKTRVFYLESPTNPTMSLVDIAQVVQMGRKHNVFTIMDNTFATPFNQRPLSYGVDAVLHSATKYLGGHGDAMAGVLVGSESFVREVRWRTNKIFGGVISPNTAWLVLRGIKTLALRMERHNANAQAVATFLAKHSKVRAVHYPGLPSHRQHQLARRQMRGFGGMLSFEVDGLKEGRRLVDNLKLCSLAVSLGDVATLIQHSASMTHASVQRERRLAVGITDGLLRLSVGIESAEEIISDLEQALKLI